VHGGAGAGAAIGGVALHNGAVHLLHKVTDQLGPQIVARRRFAGGDLDGCLTFRRPAEGIVDLYQAFRRDIGGKIRK
jgi:hypothetical protein